MDLDLFLRRDALVDEELVDVTAMVALQLDDVTPLRVGPSGAIAAPGFFKVAR